MSRPKANRSFRRARAVLILALSAAFLLLPAASAPAGDQGYKCGMDAQTCLNHMVAELKNKGWIGIDMEVDEKTGLWTIRRIVPGSPAEASGIQKGDILVSVNGFKFSREDNAFEKVKDRMKPGAKLDLGLSRGGKEEKLTVTLAALPPDVMATIIGMHMIEHAQPPDAPKN